MKEPKQDDERLAALLEGRVVGAQREDMLTRLAAADDDYEVFAGTAGVLRALEEEDARARRPGAAPSTARGGWRAPGLRSTMVVTGTMVLLLALGLVWKGRAPSPARTPQQLALAAYPSARGLPAGWTLPAPSGAARGGVRGAGRTAQAVYAGAGLVDLAVAVRARDTANIRMLARRLDGQLNLGAGDTPLRRISERPDAPEPVLGALLEQATGDLADQRSALELGAWLEAGRLAARQQNAAFFEDGSSGEMLRRAARMARNDPGARAAVDAARREVRAASRWETLETTLRTLLSELSG